MTAGAQLGQSQWRPPSRRGASAETQAPAPAPCTSSSSSVTGGAGADQRGPRGTYSTVQVDSRLDSYCGGPGAVQWDGTTGPCPSSPGSSSFSDTLVHLAFLRDLAPSLLCSTPTAHSSPPSLTPHAPRVKAVSHTATERLVFPGCLSDPLMEPGSFFQLPRSNSLYRGGLLSVLPCQPLPSWEQGQRAGVTAVFPTPRSQEAAGEPGGPRTTHYSPSSPFWSQGGAGGQPWGGALGRTLTASLQGGDSGLGWGLGQAEGGHDQPQSVDLDTLVWHRAHGLSLESK